MDKPPMAFHHSKGLTPSWQFAQKYIEGGGRIATLPDIIDARLATQPDEFPWKAHFTTQSAEYMGVSQGGNKIILVAHGVGPLTTLDGIQAAYRFEYKNPERVRYGGRISRGEFLKLESGHYGPVFVVDFNLYMRRYEYPFINPFRFSDLQDNPLFMARLGGTEKVERYLQRNLDLVADWHTEKSALDPDGGIWATMPPREREAARTARRERHLLETFDPYLAVLGQAGLYTEYTLESGMAFAHLLSIGQLTHTHHKGVEVLTFDLNAHNWRDAYRFVGVPKDASMSMIHPGWDNYHHRAQYWEELMRPRPATQVVDLRQLMTFGGQWFTMATGEPELLVIQKQQLGSPIEFLTEVQGHQMFFCYDIRDVRAVAPAGANGFTLEDSKVVLGTDSSRHRARLTFYQIEVDVTRQLREAKDVEDDYDTQMRLLLG